MDIPVVVNLEKRKATNVSVKLTNKLPESATQLNSSSSKICLVCVTIRIISLLASSLSPQMLREPSRLLLSSLLQTLLFIELLSGQEI
jgi:hypothetical protein